MWKLGKVLLKQQMVKEEIKKEIINYLEMTENTTHQNLQNAAKADLRQFIVINVFIKKEKKNSNKQPNFIHQRIRERTLAKGRTPRVTS